MAFSIGPPVFVTLTPMADCPPGGMADGVAVAEELKADGSVYEAMARDVYAMGYYLAHFKYRFLRLSYLFFLGGFFFAALVEAVHIIG